MPESKNLHEKIKELWQEWTIAKQYDKNTFTQPIYNTKLYIRGSFLTIDDLHQQILYLNERTFD